MLSLKRRVLMSFSSLFLKTLGHKGMIDGELLSLFVSWDLWSTNSLEQKQFLLRCMHESRHIITSQNIHIIFILIVSGISEHKLKW